MFLTLLVGGVVVLVVVLEGLGVFLIGKHSTPSFARLPFSLDILSVEFASVEGRPPAYFEFSMFGLPFVRFPGGGEEAPVATVRSLVLTMINTNND